MQPEPVTAVEIPQPEAQIKDPPENWGKAIKELENFFAAVELPTQPIRLNKCSTITDCSQFIENHLTTVKANEGNKVFEAYLIRLKELRKSLLY